MSDHVILSLPGCGIRLDVYKRQALRFMASLCCMALEQSLSLNPEKHPVVLSGGVFQNRFLLSGVTRLLEENGFSVYTHRQAAANDEGLSLGQLAIAQKKSETKGA